MENWEDYQNEQLRKAKFLRLPPFIIWSLREANSFSDLLHTWAEKIEKLHNRNERLKIDKVNLENYWADVSFQLADKEQKLEALQASALPFDTVKGTYIPQSVLGQEALRMPGEIAATLNFFELQNLHAHITGVTNPIGEQTTPNGHPPAQGGCSFNNQN